MAKGKNVTVFFCQECGYETSKWMGQCPGCKAWNTFVEERVSISSGKMGGASKTKGLGEKAEPVKLSDVSMDNEERMSTQIEELDRVLGGGIVPGSLTDRKSVV